MPDNSLYLIYMQKVHITPAPTPKTPRIVPIATLYAAILTLMAVSQLFYFEEFISLIGSFWLPVDRAGVYVIASSIVIAEVFALPFLLRMYLSPLMRLVSMTFGWIVPAIWLILCVWIQLQTHALSNIGFLGEVVDIPPGWWSIVFSASLGVLAAWASWGMWPRKLSD